jgi:hypothetical protein
LERRDELARLAHPAEYGEVGVSLAPKPPDPYEQVPCRPLFALSDFVCESLGEHNSLIREGRLSANDLLVIVEAFAAQVPQRCWADLLLDENSEQRRVAMLDLVWIERSLAIAWQSQPGEYHRRRYDAEFFARTRDFALAEQRHPVLSWSDIAIYHPVHDPRSFLEPGLNRDQEVFMYRVQGAIERVFRSILELCPEAFTHLELESVVQDLDLVGKAMNFLNRARTVGQFYTLDPFLGPNNEYRGHGTGAFSAWSFLMGVFLSDNPSFRSRLLDPTNRLAFDTDARPLMDATLAGTRPTLLKVLAARQLPPGDRADVDRLHGEAVSQFLAFLRGHKGAIRRHAETSFSFASPADPTISNREAIDEAIAGSREHPASAVQNIRAS